MTAFLLNDRLVRTEASPTMVALDFIRETQHLRGTKTGCREGDCGACTVLLGEPDASGAVQYRPMTSCLLPVGNLHGKHLVTIEGLNAADGALNRAQQAIVDHGGTQCGFCTVGFAVSLTGHCLGHGPTTPEETVASIDGNICRCTGYKSLERAAAQLSEELQARPAENALPWLSERGFVPTYFADVPARLAALREPAPAPAPTTARPFLGGGTDLLVQRPDEMLTTASTLLFDRPALRGIRREGDTVLLGGAVTAQELLESGTVAAVLPGLRQHLRLVSSTPIRQMGTVAGNFCNASPIGDLTAMFLALDATLTLRREGGDARQLKLRDFYRGYKQLAKDADEWVETVAFAVPGPTTRFNFEKVSKRMYLDIASTNSAALLTVEDGIIREAHLSGGGVFATPKYLANTCAFLRGKALTPATLHAANEVMQAEITPISDARGTEAYKRLLLRQLFWAHFLTLYPELIHADALVG